MQRLLVATILALVLVGCSGANANKESTSANNESATANKESAAANRQTWASPTVTEGPVATTVHQLKPPTGMLWVPDAIFEFRNGEQKQKAQVSSFFVDQYEVTLEDFNKFVASSGYKTSATEAGEAAMFKEVNSHGPNFPVGFVSMKDAKAYCAKLGKRLPTPQEWQLAALGVDGRQWPWGSWSDNTANVNTHAVSKIGSYPKDKSPFGAFDMGGNMLEWTTEGSIGGSYVTDFQNPTTLLKNIDDWVENTGFRCASSVK